MEKWISVDERLPEAMKPVLVWDADESAACIAFRGLSMKWQGDMVYWNGDQITHWMELPTAPR